MTKLMGIIDLPLARQSSFHASSHEARSHIWMCLQPGKLMLITEFMETGDLYTAMARDRATPRKFSWWRPPSPGDQDKRLLGFGRRIALDIARALAYLHARKVKHQQADPVRPCSCAYRLHSAVSCSVSGLALSAWASMHSVHLLGSVPCCAQH